MLATPVGLDSLSVSTTEAIGIDMAVGIINRLATVAYDNTVASDSSVTSFRAKVLAITSRPLSWTFHFRPTVKRDEKDHRPHEQVWQNR